MSNTLLAPDDYELQQFSSEDKSDAAKTAAEISETLDAIHGDEEALARNYTRAGLLLKKVQTRKFWILWGHRSFGAYIASIRDKLEKGRSQAYELIGVVEKLLPQFSESELADMGISKAKALKQVMSDRGSDYRFSEEIKAKALDERTTVAELREFAFKEANVQPENVGQWRDLQGFYATAEEWREIQKAMNSARLTDPPIPKSLPTWCQLKEILTRFALEYLSTYGEDGNGGA